MTWDLKTIYYMTQDTHIDCNTVAILKVQVIDRHNVLTRRNMFGNSHLIF